MTVLQYFKNTPRSPPIGWQAQSVIFFLQIRNEVPGEKKGGLSPPNGRQGLSPTPGATGACRPLGGRQGPLPLRRRMPSFPLSFEPKNLWKKLEWLPCFHIFLKWWKGTAKHVTYV